MLGVLLDGNKPIHRPGNGVLAPGHVVVDHLEELPGDLNGLGNVVRDLIGAHPHLVGP